MNAFVDDRNDSKRAEARVEDFMVEVLVETDESRGNCYT